MIDEIMTEYSNKYLLSLFKDVKQKRDIGLMGGWAVHYLLKEAGIEHIGSRDIDIFFNPNKIPFEKIRQLIESKGFKPHSTFRWVKFIHRLSGREMNTDEASKIPQYDQCVVYVDVAAPQHIDSRVMEQPLLNRVFDGEFKQIMVSNTKIMVPNERLMIEMKLNSSGERGDPFKKSKDIADLFMLVYNEPVLLETTDKKLRKKFRSQLEHFRTSGSLADAASMLGVPVSRILRTLEDI
ncbi:MAG: hypothetical protein J4432_03315 [DPANN group archaeon]|nr:hypothetical protein [DPANN group archaeon]